jgi:ABC-2 type transport system permease protein
MSANVPPRNSLAAETLVFASHLLTRWRRQPIMLIQALVYPTFLLFAYKMLVGKSIIRITGTDSLYGLVPMCAVAGAMLGSLAAGRHIWIDRNSGLIGRLWVFPVHRASALTGRLLAEAARTLVSSLLVTAVGVGLGLHFKGGWLEAIPFILVPVLVVLVFSMAVMAIAVRARTSSALTWLAVPTTGAVFASSGVVPLQTLPPSVRLEVQLQPMWATIALMRGLSQGGPVLWPLLLTVMWVVGLAAVLGPLAIRGYRAAAESGR